MNIIALDKLNKKLESEDKKTIVFKKLSFSVKKGEFVCVFGKSGSGKTTLLNIISGLISPDEGSLKFFIKSPRIGYVFQDDRLLPWKTVEENLAIVLTNRKDLNKNKIQKLINKNLKMVGLNKRAKSYPINLSGGEKQRVSLARALVTNPDLLLMDEPFSHLDEITARSLRTDVKVISRRAKTTVILVTHHPVEALYFADRIIVISKKRKNVSNIIRVPKDFSKSEDYYETLINHPGAKPLLNKLIGSLS